MMVGLKIRSNFIDFLFLKNVSVIFLIVFFSLFIVLFTSAGPWRRSRYRSCSITRVGWSDSVILQSLG